MPKFLDKRALSYSPKELYDLVMDIEKYPIFLPWCGASRIVEKNDEYIIADLIIQYKAFTEKYRSKVVGYQDNEDYFISVSLVEGSFTHLNNDWKFYKQEDNNTMVEFCLDFSFKSTLLEKIIGVMFEQSSKTIIAAFQKRAKEIYENKTEKIKR